MFRAAFLPQFPLKPIMALAVAIAAGESALAAPSGGQVVGGQGTITLDGTTTSVVQDTQRLAIDWQTFDIGTNERIQFIQPGSDSIALNRVLSSSASEILGRIEANGNVVLVNPHGILFGESATVDVGGLVASGLRIDPTQFMNGELLFSDTSNDVAGVVNKGIINAATGGNVALLGRQVSNEGFISAQLGTVTLAAGRAAVLTFDDSGLLGVRVSREILQNQVGVDPAVSNAGRISAGLGRVLLTASASQDVFSQAVNAGQLEGKTRVAVHADGSFTLGRGAAVVNTGLIDVSGDPAASVDASAVVMLGSDVRHSGDIKVTSVDADRPAEVVFAASERASLDGNASVMETKKQTSSHASVAVLGKLVELADDTRIRLAGNSDIQIGGQGTSAPSRLVATEQTMVGKNVKLSTTANGAKNTFGRGGDISVWSRQSTVVEGDMDVRGIAASDQDPTGGGGSVALTSLGTLRYSGRANIGAGGEHSDRGLLRLQATQLTLGADDAPAGIRRSSLQYSMLLGDVSLEASESIDQTPGDPLRLRLGYDLRFSALGEPGDPSGVIDLKNLMLITDPYDGFWRTKNIRFEADRDIVAPAIISTPELALDPYDSPARVNVHLISHHDSVIHPSNIITYGGNYIARAKHDIRFATGASLHVDESFRGSGIVNLVAGETIDLPVTVRYPGDFILDDPDYDPTDPVYAGSPFSLTGKDVNLWALQGLIGGEISATNLTLIVESSELIADYYQTFATITDHTHLIGRNEGILNLYGELNTISIEATGDSTLFVNPSEALQVGDVLASEQSSIGIRAGYWSDMPLTQLPGTHIESYNATVSLGGSRVSLGADGTSTTTINGGGLSVDFRESLLLNGLLKSNAGQNYIRFGSLSGPNEVTIGEFAEFELPDPEQVQLFTGSEADIINLYANLPFKLYPGFGLDTINILSPDVAVPLIVYDPDGSVIVPYTP